VTGVGQRKERSDKKRDVKPVISIELKDAIYRLAYITQTPIKDVAERMINHAITEREIIDNLSQSFRRDVRINNTLHHGHIQNRRISKREEGERERITLRLTQRTYEVVAVLAYALDVSASRVCALLLDESMHDFRFVNGYVNRYLSGKLSESQMRELRDILRYVNEYEDDQMTLASLLSSIVDEVSAPVTRMKDAVSEFIVKSWRDN